MQADLQKKQKSRIYGLMVLVILAWGLSWPANKLGLLDIPALWFASLRLIIATLAMLVITWRLKKLSLPDWRDLPIICALGIFQIGLFMLFINLALSAQSASRSVILVYTTPLWVIPPAVLLFKEKSSRLKWLGFLLGLLGVLVMLDPWQINWLDVDVRYGSICSILAALSFSVSILCARHMKWYKTPLQLIPWQLLLASVLLCIIAKSIDPHPMIHWNFLTLACLLYTALIATALGFWGMIFLSKELPSTLISLAFLGVPVSGLIFSVLLLHEKLQGLMMLAMGLIAVGLCAVALSERKKGKS